MAKRSFGEILKSEREIREVTLNEVTVATRIPPRFLEAFEQEDWEKLPGGVFNRGFVRAIARYLGLNEENLLSEYDLAYGEQQTAATALVENPIPSPPKWIVAVAALGVLIVVGCVLAGGVYGWRRYQARRAAKRAAVAAMTAAPPTLPSIAPTSPGASASPPSSSLVNPPGSFGFHFGRHANSHCGRWQGCAGCSGARLRDPSLFRAKPIRGVRGSPLRGVAGIERASNAAARGGRHLRYTSA